MKSAAAPFPDAVLACPLCHAGLDTAADGVRCPACDLTFRRSGAVLSFICREMYGSDEAFEKASSIIKFWGAGWEQRLGDANHAVYFQLDQEKLRNVAREELLTHQKHHSALGRELDVSKLEGLTVLNIGCGAGTESLVLAANGGRCLGMDITAPAANAADHLIHAVGGTGAGIQADARFLPLRSNSVDVVYSSGVLHHSPDIGRSIDEIRRVLKPGGLACIMLYASWSILFGQEKLGGMLRGRIGRRRQEAHVSGRTEGAWITDVGTNPLTTTFSRPECRGLFRSFERVEMRKGTFSVRQIRFLGRLLAAAGVVDPLNRLLAPLEPVLGACIYVKAIK